MNKKESDDQFHNYRLLLLFGLVFASSFLSNILRSSMLFDVFVFFFCADLFDSSRRHQDTVLLRRFLAHTPKQNIENWSRTLYTFGVGNN